MSSFFFNSPFQGSTSVAVLSLCVYGFVRGVLLCHYLFLISRSFGASGCLCFVTVAFPGYLHISFLLANVFFSSHV